MKKHPYSFNEFIFKENNAQVIIETFEGNIKIEGYTEWGKYKFEYNEFDSDIKEQQ